MSIFAQAVEGLLERADQRLLALWYQAASIRVGRLRDALRERRATFVDPHRAPTAPLPPLIEVDRTAQEILEDAIETAAGRSRLAGLAGALSLPTEVVSTTVASLRLAQRLCVVYGFDPDTDRGRMALCQALAVAFDTELPPAGPVGFKVSELAEIVRVRSTPPSVSARLTRAMATQTALWAVTRPGRWLPLVGAHGQAARARARTEAAGQRMVDVLRRLSELPGFVRDHLEDAQEVVAR